MYVHRFTALAALLIAPSFTAATASVPPRYDGCAVFSANDWYTRDVSRAPVDANSSRYISSMWNAGGTGTFVEAPEQIVNVAPAAAPLVPVRPAVRWHKPIATPWLPAFAIEATGDHHALVFQRGTCRVFELYGASYNSVTGVLTAYNSVAYDLRRPYQVLARGTPSSMASGLSLFAGMVKWREIEAGRINHALNWAATYNTASQYVAVPPASATDSIPFHGTSGFQMPYGAHLRLKASYDVSHLPAQAKALAAALQRYGMYLSDTGYTNKLYFEKPPAGRTYDVSPLLDNLTVRDFEVVRLSGR